MTLAKAMLLLRELGYSITRNGWNEYEVKVIGSTDDEQTYFTNDIQDAVDTAKAEVKANNYANL
jgi:hypothetical protein